MAYGYKLVSEGDDTSEDNYWNIVHGNTPDEVVKDEEGMQTMRLLGQNFAWLVKSIDAAKKQGIELPQGENKIKTNYIR